MKKKFAILLLLILILPILIYNGYIWPNKIFANQYAIHGIDISHHQKEINWEDIKNHNFKFVFMKATEGIDFKDRLFNKNWVKAKEVGLIRGAYHFFTFKGNGIKQAENFIGTVPVEENTLPPVIDLEFDGNSKSVPSKEKIVKELKDFIDIVEKAYNQKPILYLTYDSYDQFIKGDFLEYKIWIRDVFLFPRVGDDREWIFWQYSNRGRVNGINTYVDLNVFYGDINEFEKLLQKN